MIESKNKALYLTAKYGGAATRGQIQRHMQDLEANERHLILDTLASDGYLEKNVKIGGRGPRTTVYVLTRKGKTYVRKQVERGIMESVQGFA